MKLLKTLELKIILLLFIGSFLSYSVSAQSFQKQDSEEEIMEYLEYLVKLRKSQSSDGAKSNSDRQLVMPGGPNPFTSQGLETGNVWSWRAYLQAKGKKIAKRKTNKSSISTYLEKETEGKQSNNSISQAESIPELQSKANGKRDILIQGDLGGGIDAENAIGLEVEEDNSFIDQATILAFSDEVNEIVVQSPLTSFEKQGTITGDVELFEVELNKDEILYYQVAASNFDLDLFVLVFDSDLNILSQSLPQLQDDSQRSIFVSPQDDTYHIMLIERTILEGLSFVIPDISVADTVYPEGIGGEYLAAFAKVRSNPEVDMFEIPLQKGDVFGIAANEQFLLDLTLLKPDGSLGITTSVYGIDPNEETPLPLDGDVGFHYVAPADGVYALSLRGLGGYEGEIGISRPISENSGPQLIYLDFTGTTLTLRDFFNISEDEIPIGANPFVDEERSISPLKDFLEDWGIENTSINNIMLAQMITDVVKENLEEDLKESNINPNFDVRIISDYGIERFGEQIARFLETSGIPHSRVLVGGSIAEFGIETIGIANAIDVGNFQANNDAITLLDVLSAPEDIDGNGTSFPTINNIPFDEVTSSKMELVAESVGNITAHEAGHYLGNWHANGGNGVFTIMDEGGFGIFGSVGLSNGGTFGVDEIDVDFTKDVYSDVESFVGLDETDINTAFALSSGNTNKISQPTEDLITSIESKISEEISSLIPNSFYSYPVPANAGEISTLFVASGSTGSTIVSLYDVQGRKISEVFNDNLTAGEIKQIDVDYAKLNLRPGYYFYKMNSGNGEKIHQIVVK